MDDLDKNAQERNLIIFGRPIVDYGGGIARFDGLTTDQLQRLVLENYISLDDRQNESPDVETMLRAGLRMEKAGATITYTGYAVTPTRSDYRVSIEGMIVEDATIDVLQDFLELHRWADELEFDLRLGVASCWYD